MDEQSRSISNELQDLRSLAATNLRKEIAVISSRPISNFSFEDNVIMYHQEAIRICVGKFSVAIDSRTNRRVLVRAISSLSDRIKSPLLKFLHDQISEATLSNLAGLKKGQYSERACDPVLYYRFIYKAFFQMHTT